MRLFSTVIFRFVEWAARNGLRPEQGLRKQQQRAVGVRGETFAYWYLRRHGYVIISRNFRAPGVKGEIDLIGLDGKILAFVEVKTRTGNKELQSLPEDAITADKRRLISRMARQFLAERKVKDVDWRFDVLAIESFSGRRPTVRLHKGAFS